MGKQLKMYQAKGTETRLRNGNTKGEQMIGQIRRRAKELRINNNKGVENG